MLSSIFISALLAGPAVAGLMARQNTVTVNHTITSVSTTTIYAYTHALSSSASGMSPRALGASLPEWGLNPINGLPAAPPRRPESAKTAAPAPSSTIIRPIVISKLNGSLNAIYKTGPASTFAVPGPTSSPVKPAPKAKAPISVSKPLVFSTYTSPNGAPKPTATNSAHPSSKPTVTAWLPTLIRSLASSAPTRAPSSYSSLSQAPPQLPTKKPTSSPAPAKPTTTAKPPPPPPPSSSSSSEEESTTNPYPYPTPRPKTSEGPKTPFSYPYPSA